MLLYLQKQNKVMLFQTFVAFHKYQKEKYKYSYLINMNIFNLIVVLIMFYFI